LFTEKAWAAVVASQQLAQQRRQQQMESEHLFASLLAQQGLAGRILEKAGVDLGSLNQKLEAFMAGQPSLSAAPESVYLGKGLNSVLDQADALKGSYGDSYIAIEHLLLALVIDDRCGKQLLSQVGTNASKLKDAVQAIRGSQSVTDQNPEGTYESLEKYGRDLDRQRTDKFVGMYVNDWTLDFGSLGREAVSTLLRRAYEARIIPKPVEVEFI